MIHAMLDNFHAVLGAIIEIFDQAIFIRKILPEGVASLMGLSVGSCITALWDLSDCDNRIVQIVKQPHSEHFHLNGRLAMQLSKSHFMSLEPEETHDEGMFCLENGDLVRLYDHEFEEMAEANVLNFARTANCRVSTPFNLPTLLKMEGPHMIMKIASLTGANVRLL